MTAFDNGAMEQLEGMIGTLRVQTSRLATKESYWVLSFPALHAQKKRSIGCRATSSERSYNSKKELPSTGTEHPSTSMRIWTALFLLPKSVIWLPVGCVPRLPGISS